MGGYGWIAEYLGGPTPFPASHVIAREDKKSNNKTMRRDTKNSKAAGYLGPVKKGLRKGAGLLENLPDRGALFYPGTSWTQWKPLGLTNMSSLVLKRRSC